MHTQSHLEIRLEMPPKKPIGGKGGALAGNAAAPGNVPGPGAPMAPGEPVAPKAGSRRLSVAAGTGTAAAAAGRRGAALRRASQAGSRTPVRYTHVEQPFPRKTCFVV